LINGGHLIFWAVYFAVAVSAAGTYSGGHLRQRAFRPAGFWTSGFILAGELRWAIDQRASARRANAVLPFSWTLLRCWLLANTITTVWPNSALDDVASQ